MKVLNQLLIDENASYNLTMTVRLLASKLIEKGSDSLALLSE
jgi:hypothetical protein